MSDKPLKLAKIYHNPSCSKSRSALKLLVQHGYQVDEFRYLEQPIKPEMLADICQMLKCGVTDIIRINEVLFQALGLSVDDQRDDQAWFEILCQYPKLIQRPIVAINQQAIIARPAEDVIRLINSQT
jgi:arsenate reductase